LKISISFSLLSLFSGRFLTLFFPLLLVRPRFDTQDALYDVAWSELHENQALVASGDGSIKLFDTAVDSFPVRAWHEHAREAFSVHWNLVGKDTFCSSSWDGTVKVVSFFFFFWHL
jgi:peroxin-7